MFCLIHDSIFIEKKARNLYLYKNEGLLLTADFLEGLYTTATGERPVRKQTVRI